MNKKAIIITTINDFTNTSISKFIEYNYDIIIVGDLKTPHNTYIDKKNIIYLHPSNFNEFNIFQELLPYNHYCRKNIGYLYALKNNYEIIFDTDDDNYPTNDFDNWDKNYDIKNIEGPKFPNMLSLFTDLNIWPRGYPLELLNKENNIKINNDNNNLSDVCIYQSLANGDPDVDAIFRLTNKNYKNEIFFDENKMFTINKNIYVQGNTQATFWVDNKLFYLLYIPVTVSFRFCDILKMYVAQKCMWEHNKLICYMSPIVHQYRNEHNLINDFISEYPMYISILNIINNIFENIKLNGDKNDLLIIYEKLFHNNIVKELEIKLVKEWLNYF